MTGAGGAVRAGSGIGRSLSRRAAGPVAVAAVAAAGLGYLLVADPNEPGHYPTCPFLALTGLYCPGCGSLRALHALALGDPVQALDRNPLTMLAVPYVAGAWLLWLMRTLDRPVRLPALRPGLIWALLGAVVAFWILRNLPGATWLAP